MRNVSKTTEIQARAYREIERIENIAAALIGISGTAFFLLILTEPIWSESFIDLAIRFALAVGGTFFLLLAIIVTRNLMVRRIARNANIDPDA